MPNYNWNRSTRRIRVSDEEKAEQADRAKAYQQSIQSNVNGLYNDYYVALENEYIPNISKYTNT